MRGISPHMSIYNKYKWINFTHKLKRHNGLKTNSSYKLPTSKLQRQQRKLENIGVKYFLIKLKESNINKINKVILT